MFRYIWGTFNGEKREISDNGDIVEVLARSSEVLRLRTKGGKIAVWQRLADEVTGRLLLGSGLALTIDAAQGLTSDEPINALPRGTAGSEVFTTYVAQSRSRGATWTIIAEAAVYEAERHRRAMGDITLL